MDLKDAARCVLNIKPHQSEEPTPIELAAWTLLNELRRLRKQCAYLERRLERYEPTTSITR